MKPNAATCVSWCTITEKQRSVSATPCGYYLTCTVYANGRYYVCMFAHQACRPGLADNCSTCRKQSLRSERAQSLVWRTGRFHTIMQIACPCPCTTWIGIWEKYRSRHLAKRVTFRKLKPCHPGRFSSRSTGDTSYKGRVASGVGKHQYGLLQRKAVSLKKCFN